MSHNLCNLSKEEQEAIELDKLTKYAKWKAKRILGNWPRQKIQAELERVDPEFAELLRKALNDEVEWRKKKKQQFKGSTPVMQSEPLPDQYHKNVHDLQRESYMRNHELDPRIQKIIQDKKDAK